MAFAAPRHFAGRRRATPRGFAPVPLLGLVACLAAAAPAWTAAAAPAGAPPVVLLGAGGTAARAAALAWVAEALPAPADPAAAAAATAARQALTDFAARPADETLAADWWPALVHGRDAYFDGDFAGAEARHAPLMARLCDEPLLRRALAPERARVLAGGLLYVRTLRARGKTPEAAAAIALLAAHYGDLAPDPVETPPDLMAAFRDAVRERTGAKGHLTVVLPRGHAAAPACVPEVDGVQQPQAAGGAIHLAAGAYAVGLVCAGRPEPRALVVRVAPGKTTRVVLDRETLAALALTAEGALALPAGPATDLGLFARAETLAGVTPLGQIVFVRPAEAGTPAAWRVDLDPLRVAALVPPAPAAPPAAALPLVTASPRVAGQPRLATWLTGGAGLVAFAVGAGCHGLALSATRDINAGRDRMADRQAGIVGLGVFYAAGSALLITSATLLALDLWPRPAGAAARAPRLVPSGGGLVLDASF